MTPTPVQCIACAHFDLRRHAGMARQGFGGCDRDPATGRYRSAIHEHHCRQFEPVDERAVTRRRLWLAEERQKFIDSINAITGTAP